MAMTPASLAIDADEDDGSAFLAQGLGLAGERRCIDALPL